MNNKIFYFPLKSRIGCFSLFIGLILLAIILFFSFFIGLIIIGFIIIYYIYKKYFKRYFYNSNVENSTKDFTEADYIEIKDADKDNNSKT